MPTQEERAAIEAHVGEILVGIESDSALWIYLEFLDDLAKGLLAHRSLNGTLATLTQILEHDALIVTCDEHGGAIATYIHGDDSAFERVGADMRNYLMRTLPGTDEFPAKELSRMPYIGRKIVAAVTMSREATLQRPITLFYLPLFEEATIHAAIKGAISANP
jgi:hypothetical protein